MPKEAAAVLEWWLPRAQEILARKLHSVMLYGSVCLDGFEPAWSDVDMCTVVLEPVTEDDAAALNRVHEDMEARFIQQGQGGWRSTQILEGEYIPAELVTEPGAAGMCYIATTGHRERRACTPLSAFYRYMLAHHGLCYAGERVAFAPPSREALLREARELMLTGSRALLRPDHADAASAISMTGVIQDIARTAVFWRDGEMLSKGAALEREIANRGPFADAYRLALQLRKAGSATCDDHRTEVRAKFLDIVGPAASMLDGLLDSRSEADTEPARPRARNTTGHHDERC